MVKPPKSKAEDELGEVYELSHSLSIAKAQNSTQLLHITCKVSYAEEPDVGNPQVRFCEGH